MPSIRRSAVRHASLPAATCQRGAYAVVLDREGRVLVVKAENGRCYLPGGRIEAGETDEAALIREIAEECGWSATVGRALGRMLQPIMNGHVMLDTSYWRARLVDQLPCAPEHGMAWLPSAEAARCLHRPGDTAAITAALP